MILVGAIGAVVTGNIAYSRLLFLGLLVVFLSIAWTWAVSRRLALRRWTRSRRANVGDVFEERFELHNRSLFLALWLEILNESPMPGAAGSRLVTMVGGKHKRSYVSRTWLTRRGAFPLGPTTITTGDPFGFFRLKRRFPAQETLIVVPMIAEISNFASPPGIISGGPLIHRKASDITPHASGVREYVNGDPVKRIHWPTTVRRGQVMVKEFEQDPQSEVWLFVDAQDIVHYERRRRPEDQTADDYQMRVDSFLFGKRPQFRLPPSSLEYAVTIAASLAHYFIAQRRAVGLVTSGKAFTALAAERSERQEGKILETLAFVEARSSLSVAGLVAAQGGQLLQGSSAILITPTVSAELLVAVDDLQRRNLRPLVILLGSQSFGGPPGTDKLMKSLTQRRIPTCPIYCDADLGAELAGFASSSVAQDVSTWKRPPLPHLT